MIRRLFGTDGLDETAIDDCELYVQEHGSSVNRSIVSDESEDMGGSVLQKTLYGRLWVRKNH